MKTVKLLIQGSTLILAASLALSANAYTDGKYHHRYFHGDFKLVNYGYINPGQTLTLAVPANVNPGARVVCWSRDLVAGKLKLHVPNYGKVKMTPNNPVVVFGAPQGQFTVKYKTCSKWWGFGKKTSYAPVHIVCKY